jgi:CheY-like chemotaxis protein
MPEMDGFEVIRAIRERESRSGRGTHLPVIALTASARSQDRDRCLAEGMDDFLAKPIKAAQLKLAIEQVVGGQARSASAAPAPPSQNSSADTLRAPAGLIDSVVLLSACGGDEAVLQRLCAALRNHLPQQVTAVEAALSAGDAPRLSAAAHKLCGMVSAFSTIAAELASTIEDHATANRLAPARPLVNQLADVSQQLADQARGLSVESLRGHS